MKKKHKTRSEAKMGNKNAAKYLAPRRTWQELKDENELLLEEIEAAYQIISEIRALVE